MARFFDTRNGRVVDMSEYDGGFWQSFGASYNHHYVRQFFRPLDNEAKRLFVLAEKKYTTEDGWDWSKSWQAT